MACRVLGGGPRHYRWVSKTETNADRCYDPTLAPHGIYFRGKAICFRSNSWLILGRGPTSTETRRPKAMPSRGGRGPSPPPRRFNSKLPRRCERYRIAVARGIFFCDPGRCPKAGARAAQCHFLVPEKARSGVCFSKPILCYDLIEYEAFAGFLPFCVSGLCVSPDVMKVPDSGYEQPRIWPAAPGARNTPRLVVLTSENGPNSASGAGGMVYFKYVCVVLVLSYSSFSRPHAP